jgi:hypothetical protein
MRYHKRCIFGTYLPAEVDSGVATCPTTPDLASLPRRAPALPRIPQLQTSLLYRGWLQCFHVSHGSGLCFPDVRALMLPRLPQPQRAMDHMNKEMLSCSRHVARLTCFQGTFVCYRSTCKTCMLL